MRRLLIALLSCGCSGVIGEPKGSEPADSVVEDRDGDGIADREDPIVPPRSGCAESGSPGSDPQQRRLTTEEYNNTLRDLLGYPAFEAPLEEGDAVTERAVRQLRDAATRAVAGRADWTRDIYGCDLSGARDDGCAANFIERFGRRAFRRPLVDGERMWLVGVYERAVAEDFTFAEAMEITTEVILQSPQLVYVTEGTTSGIGQELTDYELATRLSLMLWRTTPDDELLDAAEEGLLSEPDGLRAQADRLLADERAAATIARFFWHWLQLDGGRLHHSLDETMKDPELFPEFTPEIQAAMRVELEAFVHRVVLEDGGSLGDLLLSRLAYVNGPLAALYGVDGPASADDWAWVELPADERAGLFTRLAFLTVFASERVHSPIRRGVFMLEEALCVELGEPPPDVDDSPVEGGESDDAGVLTVRQDVLRRTQGTECQACHGVINPIGFAFEHYDAIGRFQTHEVHTGLEIDSSGRIQLTDVDRDVADALELSRALGGSGQLASCFADHLTSEAFRTGADACLVESVGEALAAGVSVRDALLQVVTSEQFRILR